MSENVYTPTNDAIYNALNEAIKRDHRVLGITQVHWGGNGIVPWGYIAVRTEQDRGFDTKVEYVVWQWSDRSCESDGVLFESGDYMSRRDDAMDDLHRRTERNI